MPFVCYVPKKFLWSIENECRKGWPKQLKWWKWSKEKIHTNIHRKLRRRCHQLNQMELRRLLLTVFSLSCSFITVARIVLIKQQTYFLIFVPFLLFINFISFHLGTFSFSECSLYCEIYFFFVWPLTVFRCLKFADPTAGERVFCFVCKSYDTSTVCRMKMLHTFGHFPHR